jgi:hypothetical protein
MNDHWQTIEDALIDKWDAAVVENDDKEMDASGAALAFVREQRAQAALLAPDAATLKEIRKFLEGQHYIASCVDDAVSPDMRRYAAALKWIDSHAKGDSDGK